MAKISDCYNDIEKANLSTKIANGIFFENRDWFFPIKFFFDERNNPSFRVKRGDSYSILVALKILSSSGKSIALWLKRDNTIGIDGDQIT